MANPSDNIESRPRVFLGDLATGTLEIFYPDITTNGAARVENSDTVAREASARLEHITKGKGARVQALHPSIAGGEFDPAHIDPAAVDDIKDRMREILDESDLYSAARARVGLTRDDFLTGMLAREEVSPFMHEWLRELATATLFRIVDRLADGGYFVTEPYVDGTISGGLRHYYHSPPPALMAAMGLEAVADLRAEKCLSMIFRKVGPSNKFVRERAAHVERILERARNGTPPRSGFSSGGTHQRGSHLPHQCHSSRGLAPQALPAGALSVVMPETLSATDASSFFAETGAI